MIFAVVGVRTSKSRGRSREGRDPVHRAPAVVISPYVLVNHEDPVNGGGGEQQMPRMCLDSMYYYLTCGGFHQ